MRYVLPYVTRLFVTARTMYVYVDIIKVQLYSFFLSLAAHIRYALRTVAQESSTTLLIHVDRFFWFFIRARRVKIEKNERDRERESECIIFSLSFYYTLQGSPWSIIICCMYVAVLLYNYAHR